METGWVKKSMRLACLSLVAVLTATGRGQMAVGADQSGTASILDRVQRENDPELGELIRIALTNRKATEKDAPEIVRRVTQSYAQIRLLDQQIEQVGQKIKAARAPVDMQSELLLAKAELESKRIVELANLREIMGVIPLQAFGRKPISILRSWVHLHILDRQVYILDTENPFPDLWFSARHRAVGLLSEEETLDYLRRRLTGKNSLPIRIDIHHTPVMRKAGEAMHRKVVSLIKEANAEIDSEVCLDLITWVGSGESTFFLREGKIRTLYPRPVRRPDGSSKDLVTGLVDPNDLEQHILWRLTGYVGNIPVKFRIEHDGASAALARRVADRVRSTVDHLGLAEYVTVAATLVETVPVAVFLGRWQATTSGEIQALDVQPTGLCLLTIGKTTEFIKTGATIPRPWVPTTKEMVIDIGEGLITRNCCAYRGYINAEGDLVVSRGVVYPQGSFHPDPLQQMIFKKVY